MERQSAKSESRGLFCTSCGGEARKAFTQAEKELADFKKKNE